MLPQAILWLKT
ncbi:hypothetical protein YPPY93_2776, partial [Yersinia pestis PY-93]